MTDSKPKPTDENAGGSPLNQGRFFMMLKPLEQRGSCKKQHFWEPCRYVTADDVINRLRGKLAVVPGATLIDVGINRVTDGTSNSIAFSNIFLALAKPSGGFGLTICSNPRKK